MRLPEVAVTSDFTEKLDRAFLDFLTSLYISVKKSRKITVDLNVWFLQEIAYYLLLIYPEKSVDDLEGVLMHIMKLGEADEISS